jgi:hypothetical protein
LGRPAHKALGMIGEVHVQHALAGIQLQVRLPLVNACGGQARDAGVPVFGALP